MERIDTDINELMRAANCTAWRGVLRRVSNDDLERSIKSLAKHFSQRTAQPVQDRRARQDARIAAYNEVVPVLRRFAENHVRLQQTSAYLALGLVAAVSIVTGMAFLG